MNYSRAPPKSKKIKTPADDPEILNKWKYLFHYYTNITGMNKWPAMKKIAKEYNVNSTTTIYYWLNKNVRIKTIKEQKDKKRNWKTTHYRIKSATTKHIYRHIDKYTKQAFIYKNNPLTLDEIILNIREQLINQNKPGILLKNKTLLKLIKNYENKQKQKLLKVIDNCEPVRYILNAKKTIINKL